MNQRNEPREAVKTRFIKSADEILATIAAYCNVITDSKH